MAVVEIAGMPVINNKTIEKIITLGTIHDSYLIVFWLCTWLPCYCLLVVHLSYVFGLAA
jgi:hypothetical protein